MLGYAFFWAAISQRQSIRTNEKIIQRQVMITTKATDGL
jgi:hypothetical protein